MESHELCAGTALYAIDLPRGTGVYWRAWRCFYAKADPIYWHDQLWNIPLSLADKVGDWVQGFQVDKRLAMVHPALRRVLCSNGADGCLLLALL